MNLNKNSKLITCILPKGKGLPLLQALSEKGVTRADLSFARGSDILAPLDSKGLLQIQEEKELVTVVADDATQAEDLFAFIYEHVDMNHIGGGMLYMGELSLASPYLLPNIEEINNGRKAKEANP